MRRTELDDVLELLLRVLRPESARDWLSTPNPLLRHREPADLLRESGYREVLGAIRVLGEGVFV